VGHASQPPPGAASSAPIPQCSHSGPSTVVDASLCQHSGCRAGALVGGAWRSSCHGAHTHRRGKLVALKIATTGHRDPRAGGGALHPNVPHTAGMLHWGCKLHITAGTTTSALLFVGTGEEIFKRDRASSPGSSYANASAADIP